MVEKRVIARKRKTSFHVANLKICFCFSTLKIVYTANFYKPNLHYIF